MRKGKINLFLMKALAAGLLLSSVLPYQAFARRAFRQRRGFVK